VCVCVCVCVCVAKQCSVRNLRHITIKFCTPLSTASPTVPQGRCMLKQDPAAMIFNPVHTRTKPATFPACTVFMWRKNGVQDDAMPGVQLLPARLPNPERPRMRTHRRQEGLFRRGGRH